MKNTLPIFSSADELDKLIDAFFKQLESKKRSAKQTSEVKIGEVKPATLTGLALHLGFNSREQFERYENKAKFAALDLPNGYGKGSLHFDDLRKKYYSELEEILTQTKKVVRYILLNPRDILELDLLIPIYLEQDSAYYYINKIDSWRKGQPTKVELVKLG